MAGRRGKGGAMPEDLKRRLRIVDGGEAGPADGTIELPGLPSLGADKPPFPLRALPAAARDLVESGSRAVGCPPDMIAVTVLATLASGVGMAREAEVKRGWTESSALYVGIVAGPGAKKTAADKVATAPAWARQKRLRAKYREEKEDHEASKRRHKAEAREAREAGVPEPPEPEAPRMSSAVTDDVTMEALGGILAGDPRGVLAARDELVSVISSLDQYKAGGGSDRQALLKMHSNSPIKIDRVGRDALLIPKPFLCISGGVQPARLSLILDGGDGMAERFLLAQPDVRQEGATRHEISEDTEAAYARLYDGLCALEMPTDGDGDPYPAKVRLSEEALDRFLERSTQLAAETRAPGFSPGLEALWAKMEGYLVRIALTLCLCRTVERGHATTREEVLPEDVEDAWEIVRYFCAHAAHIRREMPSSQEEDIERYLCAIVWSEGSDGRLKVSPSALYERLERAGCPLPGDAGALSKAVLRIAEDSPRLSAASGWSGNKRTLRLELAPEALFSSTYTTYTTDTSPKGVGDTERMEAADTDIRTRAQTEDEAVTGAAFGEPEGLEARTYAENLKRCVEEEVNPQNALRGGVGGVGGVGDPTPAGEGGRAATDTSAPSGVGSSLEAGPPDERRAETGPEEEKTGARGGAEAAPDELESSRGGSPELRRRIKEARRRRSLDGEVTP